jgi:hypothetical protein
MLPELLGTDDVPAGCCWWRLGEGVMQVGGRPECYSDPRGFHCRQEKQDVNTVDPRREQRMKLEGCSGKR